MANEQNSAQNSENDESIEFIGKKFEEVKNELKTKADKADVDIILTRLNHIPDVVSDNRAEQLATKRQVDQHQQWITKAAPKIGVNLPN